MTNIEKIRQEIERLKEEYNEQVSARLISESLVSMGKVEALNKVLAFIDSLSEETSYDINKLTPTPSVNIEDVARVQFASHAHVFDHKRKAVFDWEQFKEVVGIFYSFGKRDSLPEEKHTCKTCGFYENNCPFIRGKLIPYPNKVCKDYTYSVMKEQKPSEDLEEAANEYADKHGFRVPYDGSNNYYDDVDVKASKAGFIAGAEWQRIRDAAHRK